MFKKKEVPVAKAQEAQKVPSQPVLQATAIPCNEASAKVVEASTSSFSVAAVASPIGGASSGITVAKPQDVCFEVVSVRLQNPVARTGPANLIQSRVDISRQQAADNHQKALESVRNEEENFRVGSIIGAQEATKEEAELRRAHIAAKQRVKQERANLKNGDRLTTASSVDAETTMVLVQVPNDVKPGMLLSVDAPQKKGMNSQRLTFAVPEGAQPGQVIEIRIGLQDADEAAVLDKMQALRLQEEEKIRKETEQEEYSYKGLGDGEYEYNPTAGKQEQAEEEYVYGS